MRFGYDETRIDRLGNVIGVIRGGEGATVMLSAHLDMVAEGDWNDWDYPPFAGIIAEGCLHGRGAMDIKGPLAIQTHVGAALAGSAEGDIVVAHPVYEERGGWGMDYLLRSGGSFCPDAVIIGEATHGDITIGHRGRAEVEIVARGLAGHASASRAGPQRSRSDARDPGRRARPGGASGDSTPFWAHHRWPSPGSRPFRPA